MKICVSAISDSLDAQIDPRFGRCQCFVIVESETMEFEAISNTASGAMHGAGIQAAQTVAKNGAKVVLTGNIGPNAFQALSAAEIKIMTGISGSVRESVERYKKGKLIEATSPTVGGHSGLGRRRTRR